MNNIMLKDTVELIKANNIHTLELCFERTWKKHHFFNCLMSRFAKFFEEQQILRKNVQKF